MQIFIRYRSCHHAISPLVASGKWYLKSMIWQTCGFLTSGGTRILPPFWLTRRTYSWNNKYVTSEQFGMISAFYFHRKNSVQRLLIRSNQIRNPIDAVMKNLPSARRRPLRWVVRIPTTAKKIICRCAPLRTPNSRKNAVILKNQAMNNAVCILFLMPTAIVWKPRCNLIEVGLIDSNGKKIEEILACIFYTS